MTYYQIHTDTLSGDVRDWTVRILQRAGSDPGAVSGVQILREATLSYGDRGATGRGNSFLESSLSLAYADTAEALTARLQAATSDDDFHVEISATGYAWRGKVALGTLRAPFYPDVVGQTIALDAYCGLRFFGATTGGTEEEAIWAASSPHVGIGVPLRAFVQDLPALYVSRLRPASWRALNPGSGHWYQTSTWYPAELPSSFRAFWDVLLETLDTRVFQAFVGGGWRIQQRATEGTAIAADNGQVASYTGSDPLVIDATTATLAASTLSITDADVRADATRLLSRRVDVVDVLYKPGDIAALDLARDGGMEFWTDVNSPVFWEGENTFDPGNIPLTRVAGRTGAFAMQVNHYPAEPSTARQALALVRGGDTCRLSASGYVQQADLGVRLRIEAEGGDWYLTSSTWSQTDAWGTWANGGAGWHARTLVAETQLPAFGVLYWEVQSRTGDPHLDDFAILIERRRPERFTESTPPATVYDPPAELYGEQGRPGARASREITATEANRKNVDYGVTVITGNVGNQYPVSKWQDGSAEYPLLSSMLASRLQEPVQAIEATVSGILAPGVSATLGATTYIVGSGCDIDLVREETTAVLIPRPA